MRCKETKLECIACACTQRASVHRKYLHCTWTDFDQILNADYWNFYLKVVFEPPCPWVLGSFTKFSLYMLQQVLTNATALLPKLSKTVVNEISWEISLPCHSSAQLLFQLLGWQVSSGTHGDSKHKLIFICQSLRPETLGLGLRTKNWSLKVSKLT